MGTSTLLTYLPTYLHHADSLARPRTACPSLHLAPLPPSRLKHGKRMRPVGFAFCQRQSCAGGGRGLTGTSV
ncbi:hypothetical protein LY78DRAFT_194916 [Colletotrichum sublineola]|nr:hypothetical protein LY78DRAFT_194916 [Colletotrichum sublineola]